MQQLKSKFMTQLSIIIVTYNTRKLTLEAVESIEKNYPKEVKSGEFEILVSDNDSSDDTIEKFKEFAKTTTIKKLIVLDNKKNLGFAKGNNVAVSKSTGKYVLFLNPDTVTYPNTLTTLLDFLKTHPDAGAVTCKVNIPSGGIDEASHRGFPTPWNAFCHFSGIEKIFPHSRLFSGYLQGWKDYNTIHTVDAIVGAFMMMPRSVGEKVGWWDEDYFFYGEDLEFCFCIRHLGYNIYYIPTVGILHYGGVSSGIKKSTQNITTANLETKIRLQTARFESMKIFYKKHYLNAYPKLVGMMVFAGINFLKKKTLNKVHASVVPVKS